MRLSERTDVSNKFYSKPFVEYVGPHDPFRAPPSHPAPLMQQTSLVTLREHQDAPLPRPATSGRMIGEKMRGSFAVCVFSLAQMPTVILT